MSVQTVQKVANERASARADAVQKSAKCKTAVQKGVQRVQLCNGRQPAFDCTAVERSRTQMSAVERRKVQTNAQKSKVQMHAHLRAGGCSRTQISANERESARICMHSSAFGTNQRCNTCRYTVVQNTDSAIISLSFNNPRILDLTSLGQYQITF